MRPNTIKRLWAEGKPALGARGYGPYRGAMYGGSDYAAHANDEIACIVQIETIGAVVRAAGT